MGHWYKEVLTYQNYLKRVGYCRELTKGIDFLFKKNKVSKYIGLQKFYLQWNWDYEWWKNSNNQCR